jgi:hypothetical protein
MVAVSVVLPVTAERESFDFVIEAAEVFPDNAECLIAPLKTTTPRSIRTTPDSTAPPQPG